jgi:prevent-host-death family protein
MGVSSVGVAGIFAQGGGKRQLAAGSGFGGRGVLTCGHDIPRIAICFYASEGAMPQTTAVEFQRKFREFQQQAQREPVEIMRHGRRELVLMSADHYDWLLAAAQRTHRTVDATSVVAHAVSHAEMDPEHAGLDDLLT